MIRRIYFLIKSQSGEIGKAENTENEYMINGVLYIADYEFQKDGKGTSLKEQIERLLQNDREHLTNENSPGTMASKCECLTAEKEDKCS